MDGAIVGRTTSQCNILDGTIRPIAEVYKAIGQLEHSLINTARTNDGQIMVIWNIDRLIKISRVRPW